MAEQVDDALTGAAQKAFLTPFGAVLQLISDEGGDLWIDGAASPPALLDKAPKGKPADCIWRGARETLLRVLDGERALESAYVSGRLKITGDMSVMTRLVLGKPK